VLKGMNLSGMSDRGHFYHPPTTAHIDYWWNNGFRLVRYPIYWERLQESVNGAFTATFWADIQAAVDYAVTKGMEVICNLHCMGQRDVNGTLRKIGAQDLPFDALADFWLKVNAVYKGNTKVHYDLINEPDGLPSTSYSTPTSSVAYPSGTEALIACFNHVTAQLRVNGSQNLLILEGNGHNNAKSWTNNWYGTSNSTAFGGGNIVDPFDKWAVSVHNYPDAEHGQGGMSIHQTILRKQMENVVAWAQANNRRVFCGEFGAVAADPDGEYNTRDSHGSTGPQTRSKPRITPTMWARIWSTGTRLAPS
jgi:endoglucanase